ncbi:MAG TPA: glycosyltransferase [Opitutaceae bacterium]|nr:glycosyltransferase [Opitutaceae bacterium]
MQLLFICTSLEPGRDGVGDYTRRLAGECATRGHSCTVIALHDPHVEQVTDLTPDNVRLIRLPATDPWPGRLTFAIQYLRRIAPDWVSWQLVAYGFHQRGFLPAALLQNAPDLRGPRCHVMLHELWLGLEVGASWRARAIGWLQHRGILCLLDQLDPDCMQTSNTSYQHALSREGFEITVLGLFGNVPIADDSSNVMPLARWLPVSVNGIGAVTFTALTFGTLHPQWKPDATVDWLLATARRLGRPPALIAVGRVGSHATAILDRFRQQGIQVEVTGELDTATVSHLLRAVDFGIASHPWALIGKSGAAAAMLDHGLPVLVPRDDWRLRGASSLQPAALDPLLDRLAGLDDVRTTRWLAGRRSPKSALPRTTDALLESMERTSPHSAALSS